MTLSGNEDEAASLSQSPEESENEDSGEAGDYQDMDRKNGGPGGGGADGGAAASTAPKRTAANAKDPNRPRRKKARRACFACQRAHLTCGDERPCGRCIKRGLQDACQDGVRKKAKYLHDAADEALMPGAGGAYAYLNSVRRPQQQSPQSPPYALTSAGDVYGPRPAASYGMGAMPPAGRQISMSEQLMTDPAYAPQQVAMGGYSSGPAQAPTSMQTLVQALETSAPPSGVAMQDYGLGAGAGGMIDAGDLSQYNFDPASFNFGNHYGALEFGMLGHMSSGAAETPPSDAPLSQMSPSSGGMYTGPGAMPPSYGGDGNMAAQQPQYMYSHDAGLVDWRPPTQPQSNVRQTGNLALGAFANEGLIKKENLDGLIVDTTVGSAFASPISDGLIYSQHHHDGSHPDSAAADFAPTSAANSRPSTQERLVLTRSATAPAVHQNGQNTVGPSSAPTSAFAQAPTRSDPSRIYANVTEPYSYTAGFHRLFAYIKRRFSKADTVRIAKAIAAIRPSFISCTKTLGAEDLVFMEKCFQRTLWEYSGYLAACGTPTIVCRRSGEIAAVGREFCHLTGWKRDVLLGKAPNLNVNTGGAAAGGVDDSGATTGTTTPRNRSTASGLAADPGRPQPVFLAELLDDDSILRFYDDFARLAFTDPRGSNFCRYRLLRYQTQDGAAGAESAGSDDRAAQRRRGRAQDQGETAAGDLGGKDGKIVCQCSWTVKRDLFDLPMMIVMNFLPCL